MTQDEAIAAAVEYSCIPPERLRRMVNLCRDLPGGCIVQCGVYRGGSGALLAWATGRRAWLFDRFVGMPKPEAIDGERAAAKWRPDWCKASLQDVTAALAALDVSPDKVRIIGGELEDTTCHIDTGPIALLHIDVDWWRPTRWCLLQFLPHVVPGGLVIVDDYHHWPGCKVAVDELGRELHEMDGTAIWFRA